MALTADQYLGIAGLIFGVHSALAYVGILDYNPITVWIKVVEMIT